MDAHGHRRSEIRSLEYHRAIAAQIERDPTLIARARDRLHRWRREGKVHPHYAARWDQILAGDPEEIACVIVQDDEPTRALRQCTPFLGVLSSRTRWSILREIYHPRRASGSDETPANLSG